MKGIILRKGRPLSPIFGKLIHELCTPYGASDVTLGEYAETSIRGRGLLHSTLNVSSRNQMVRNMPKRRWIRGILSSDTGAGQHCP